MKTYMTATALVATLMLTGCGSAKADDAKPVEKLGVPTPTVIAEKRTFNCELKDNKDIVTFYHCVPEVPVVKPVIAPKKVPPVVHATPKVKHHHWHHWRHHWHHGCSYFFIFRVCG